jgi:hypothetical protein
MSREAFVERKFRNTLAATERRSKRTQEIEPLRGKINRRFAEAISKAVASAHNFNPGSYTAQALSDVLAVNTMLKWLDDACEAAK